MKVSIITSCYNREATIRGAIESVLEQDYPDIEYIVVDGASKDNSLAVINEYKNGIDTIISEPDKGIFQPFRICLLAGNDKRQRRRHRRQQQD